MSDIKMWRIDAYFVLKKYLRFSLISVADFLINVCGRCRHIKFNSSIGITQVIGSDLDFTLAERYVARIGSIYLKILVGVRTRIQIIGFAAGFIRQLPGGIIP